MASTVPMVGSESFLPVFLRFGHQVRREKPQAIGAFLKVSENNFLVYEERLQDR